MKETTALMNFILASIGMLYIMFKAGDWVISMALKGWCKRRKESAKQKAVNDLFDAFEMEKVSSEDTIKIRTKGGLIIMMYRENKGD